MVIMVSLWQKADLVLTKVFLSTFGHPGLIFKIKNLKKMYYYYFYEISSNKWTVI